jgi:aryl-alcohol dehydrogenase
MARMITAAVIRRKGGPFRLERLRLDAPRADEVQVRLAASGICHTDLVMRDDPGPGAIVLGHEGAGVVERVGRGVRKLAPGDHVVLSFLSCGACRFCTEGRPARCRCLLDLNFSGTRPDGSTPLRASGKPGRRVRGRFFAQSSFATHALAHERSAVKVPKDVPLELLGPLGCGIQTGAGAVMNSLAVDAGSSFAVFGAGGVGLSAVMAVRVVGAATIVAVDRVASRLQLAAELGATLTVNARHEDAVTAIRAATGDGADFTLDTTGNPQVIRQAVAALGPSGACGILGASPEGATLGAAIDDVLGGSKSIRGIIEGDSVPDLFIPKLIELFREGRFPFDRLVRFYDFEAINQAVRDSEAGTTVKPILRISAPVPAR